MGKINCYIKSARLRTLPLSLAGIVTGVGLAAADYVVDALTACMAALTAICLQILSNVSNEYGDFIHGIDNENRQGPKYSQGEMTDRDYRRMVIFWVAASCISGLAMIWTSYGTLMQLEPVMFLILGVFAITAAMRYTLGSHPYGYSGHGDIAVFIFFGLTTVLGSYFLVAHEIPSWYLVLPASSVGLLAVGVLNVNNLRDMKTDADTKITVALRLGERKAKIYQTLLICLAWALMVIYVCGCRIFDWWHLLFVLTLPIFTVHIAGIWRKSDGALDRYLPMLVIGIFLMSICLAVGFNAYRWFY